MRFRRHTTAGDTALPSWPLALSCVSFPFSLHPIPFSTIKVMVLFDDCFLLHFHSRHAERPPATMYHASPHGCGRGPFSPWLIIDLTLPAALVCDHSTNTPTWVLPQQDAELYGIFHAIHHAHLIRLSLCIYTDNSLAFFTLLSGRVPSTQPMRARILRRIYRMCISHDMKFQLVRLSSKRNPADLYSRPYLLTRTPTDFHTF